MDPVEGHKSKNICAAQIGLDGVKNRIQNWENWEGDLRRDIGGADTIKTHYPRLSSNNIFKYNFISRYFKSC